MVALWIHLLTNASYENNEFLGIKIAPGQLVTGRKKLAFETGISQRTIRTCLERLKSTNEVTIKTTTKYSIISIVKWEEYQARDQVIDQQPTNERPTSDQRATTTQEGKETKKVKNSIINTNAREKKNGSRINEDWKPSAGDREYAAGKGLSETDITDEAEKFLNYWTSKTGSGASKLAWDRVWRNWILQAIKYTSGVQQSNRGANGGKGGSAHERAYRAAGEAVKERYSGNRDERF